MGVAGAADNLKVAPDSSLQPPLAVHHAGILAKGHAVHHGYRMKTDKRAVSGSIKYRAVNIITVRIRTVKDNELFPVFGACLHYVTHCSQVRVKPGPHILDVKDNNIYISQIFRCRFFL